MLRLRRAPLAITLLVVAIALLLAGARYARHELQAARERTRTEEGATLAALLARTLQGTPMAEADGQPRLLRLVHYAARNVGLEYALLVDRHGRVIDHTNEQYIHTVIRQGPGLEAATLGRATAGPAGQMTASAVRPAPGGIMEYASPIFGPEGCEGAVVVGLRSTGTAVGLAELRPFLIPAVAMLLLIPCAFVVVRLSVRPLLATGEELRALLAAQRVPGLPALAGTEPSEVAAGLRELVRELVRRYRDQDQSRQDLELQARVHEFERRRLENVLEQLPEGLILEGPDGRVELANRAASNILSRPREELLGAGGRVGELLLPGPKEAGQAGAAGLRPPSSDDVHLSSIPLYDGHHITLGTLHLVRDLSAQHQADQAQHEFVSHLAHEVKNPLNTIRSYTEMLLDGEMDDRETRKEFCNTINQEAERLARLVENLLSLSRIELGQLRLEKQFVKAQNLIEHAVHAVAPLARAKSVELRVNLPDRLGSLSGDRQLLEVALINILGNAVKYTPSGGQVTLAAEECPDRFSIQVTDTGPGIRPEDQTRIFDKFFRSSAPEVSAQPGHGLGLSLSREILGLHGGQIRLQSAPGAGAAFTLELPRETGDGELHSPGDTPAPLVAAAV